MFRRFFIQSATDSSASTTQPAAEEIGLEKTRNPAAGGGTSSYHHRPPPLPITADPFDVRLKKVSPRQAAMDADAIMMASLSGGPLLLGLLFGIAIFRRSRAIQKLRAQRAT
ncbi:hypothetical protein B0T26DRAFT_868435 [Lasiosphaeria miniovina]|uniref:Uncharacterized protein n=1 Tax=Lasiosphaeria miniovina TaxID=1954250 RepID=A0AA40E6P9_9PEZI|nr:uncharacterized protein B0T26DRAFT_868435 [Lasiosphaeria miniovina]KAK0727057.1 hypothetical protein B0T26DRAFT_868435 [Lasiosphaeria miniovina]